jgi:hypothetical protein
MRRTKGLLGSAARTAGRTAIIAGTATHVVGRVGGNQAARHAPPPAAAPIAPVASHPIGGVVADEGDHLIAQIERLAELRAAGVLSDEEFASAKRKLLV